MVGDRLQLVMGNAGPLPELPLAPYVNGYLFEGFNFNWEGPYLPTWESKSPEMWRAALDAYRRAQQLVRKPAINLIEGNGPGPLTPVSGGNSQITPTAADLQRHRFTMGTALLGDGFYFYNLVGDFSPPYFYDEYAVDGTGTAVEDRSKKGYLGQALTDAVELASSSTLIFSEDFEEATLPASFYPGSQQTTVDISHLPSEVISGTGSLVISNSDHTKQSYNLTSTVPGVLQFSPGNAYRVVFDYRIIETLDGPLHMDFWDFSSNSAGLGLYLPPGVVAGDSGTADFPVTVTSSGNWSLRIGFFNGGGKIAVDNLRVYQGGVGPWRRDFENGLVLVNPFLQSHTFSAADLAGVLQRTGISRIKGTQAPDVNNGQPVTDSLTLGPFDAITLLADPIRLTTPIVTGVANAAGGQPGVASGAFVSIYGSNFTPLAYDDWSKSITNGQLPTQLDGLSVTIGGKPAYINAITPGQINVQAPDLGKGPVQVVVTTGGGASTPFATNSQLYSPAFFPWPGNQPVATHADYTWAVKNGTFPGTTTVPAKPGEVIVLWGTGFGPTNPPVPAGQEPRCRLRLPRLR